MSAAGWLLGWPRSVFGAESAEQIDKEADDEKEAQATATISRTAVVEAAAAEENQEDHDRENKVHGRTVAERGEFSHGAFTCRRLTVGVPFVRGCGDAVL